MAETRDLLEQYARTGCEQAFRGLVERYVNLVYSTAWRTVDGNAELARDVAQAVFIDLAGKARGLSPNVLLGGWLHRRTFHVAKTVLRGERRRIERERRAVEMTALNDASAEQLDEIAPLLDEAINNLGEKDRSAVLLRFFEDYDFAGIGRALGTSEDAARMRVSRALEKLQGILRHQGVTLSSTGMVAALAGGAATAAPVGFAGAISVTALAAPASTVGAAATILGMMCMAKLKTGIVCVAIAAGIVVPFAWQHQSNARLRGENESLRQKVAQLDAVIAEQERLSGSLRNAPALRLPAPPLQPITPPVDTALNSRGTQLITQILNSTNLPQLTRQQLESFLQENRRNAGSLLAAFRATGDQALLLEAIQKFPNDPQVAFTAAYRLEGADRRQWLETFKQSAPENALASYLSAAEFFKSGNFDKAVQELTEAAGKKQFVDYTLEFGQHDEEAWRAAGYSVAEAKTIGASSLLLPHLAETKELTHQMVNLANAYRQAGDAESAEATLQIAIGLGQRLDQSPGTPLITQLVGRAIERISLGAMDPTAPYVTGQTVQQRLDQLARDRARIEEAGRQFEALTPRLTEQDWISFRDRWRMFGEEEALKWIVGKYGPQ